MLLKALSRVGLWAGGVSDPQTAGVGLLGCCCWVVLGQKIAFYGHPRGLRLWLAVAPDPPPPLELRRFVGQVQGPWQVEMSWMSGIVVVQRCGRLSLTPSRKISQAALCHFRSVFTLSLTKTQTKHPGGVLYWHGNYLNLKSNIHLLAWVIIIELLCVTSTTNDSKVITVKFHSILSQSLLKLDSPRLQMKGSGSSEESKARVSQPGKAWICFQM